MYISLSIRKSYTAGSTNQGLALEGDGTMKETCGQCGKEILFDVAQNRCDDLFFLLLDGEKTGETEGEEGQDVRCVQCAD